MNDGYETYLNIKVKTNGVEWQTSIEKEAEPELFEEQRAKIEAKIAAIKDKEQLDKQLKLEKLIEC